MNRYVKVLLGLSVGVILVASGFIGGFAVARLDVGPLGIPAIAAAESSAVSEHVDEAYGLLQREALKPPNETSATAGAIQGLLEGVGDTYGAYFDPRHYGYFNEEMSGEFGGIGVSLGEQDGNAYVVEVFPDTPASRGGIKPDDRFASIDGVRRDKWSVDEVVKRVRGKEGTDVKLVMIRPGSKGKPGKEYDLTLTREMITFPNTKSEMKDGVGYIRLAQFNGNATDEISQAVKSLTKKGARSLVLDLRNNPGGSLEQAVSVASLFVPSGVIVRVEERGRPEVEHRTVGEAVTDKPVVVLVNGNSASASEIVAGALQDYGRAKLVGEKTFGKGSVQTVRELSFGGALKFTTAHYLTPKKRAIDGKGLTPDIVVKMDIEDEMTPEDDAQLKRAILEAKKAAR